MSFNNMSMIELEYLLQSESIDVGCCKFVDGVWLVNLINNLGQTFVGYDVSMVLAFERAYCLLRKDHDQRFEAGRLTGLRIL